MTINAFEGARRIAKLAAASAVIGYVGFVAYEFENASVAASYQIKRPDFAPVRVERCGVDDLTKDLSEVQTRKVGYVSVYLCFPQRESRDGRKVVLYTFDPATNQGLGAERDSAEVRGYVQRTTDAFVIPPADADWIAGLRWSERWKSARKAVIEGAGPLLASFVFLWAFTWTIGWIVRGFLGIPRGQDYRPSAPEK